MRAHPRDIGIQMLGFEAVDKISEAYGTVGAGRLAFAPVFAGDCNRITHDEASDIMSKASQEGQQKYREYHSDASKLWVELDSPPDNYPCNDKVTRGFFSDTWDIRRQVKHIARNEHVGATERVQALVLCSLRALNGEASVAHSA